MLSATSGRIAVVLFRRQHLGLSQAPQTGAGAGSQFGVDNVRRSQNDHEIQVYIASTVLLCGLAEMDMLAL